jgi:hypothetical protein
MKKLQVIFLFVFLVGCSSNQDALLTTTPNIVQTPSPFPTQIAILPTQTLTPTSTFTATYTPLPTWTPLSTIEPDKGLQTLYEWLEGTEECRLPCWAGIIPGKTTWEGAKQLLESTRGFLNLSSYLEQDCVFGKCNEIAWSLDLDPHGYVYSIFPENKIHTIVVETFTPEFLKHISLQKVLNNYGKPTIILFSTEPDLPNYDSLELILVYPERQFIIKYAKYAEITKEKVESCGKDSYIKLVILDNREQLKSLEIVANLVDGNIYDMDLWQKWHKSVEEAMGLTIDEFYETYSKENAPCITTPTKIWLP